MSLAKAPLPRLPRRDQLLFVGLLGYFLAAGVFLPSSSILYKVGSCGVILGAALWLYVRRDVPGYAKLSLVVACTASQQIGYFFVLVTLALFRDRVVLRRVAGLGAIRLLAVLGLLSYVVNQFVELNLLSYPFFLLSFFLPVIYFPLFHEAGEERQEEILAFFFRLLVVIGTVVLVQTLLHWDESPDWRTGGTLQAHMAGILLACGFVIALARRLLSLRGRVPTSLSERFVLLGGLPLVFLVDAKYVLGLLLGCLATVMILWVGWRPDRVWRTGLLTVAVLVSMIGWRRQLLDVPVVLSTADLSQASVPLRAVIDGFWVAPRGQILAATLNLPRTEPRVFWTGSGPGTFLSRAANSRAYDTMQKSEFDQVGGEREVRSKLPRVLPPFTSWVTKKYALDVIHWSRFQERTWQSGLVRWPSSVTSVLWEFGVIGLAAFVAFYVALLFRGLALRAAGDRPQWVGFAISVLALWFLTVAYFDVWLETPQFAMLHWGLLGLLARAGQLRPGVGTPQATTAATRQ